MLNKIAIVGLGYVGLPLALLADRKGYEVLGFDINKDKIKALSSGKSVISDATDKEVGASSVKFTDDPKQIKTSDVIIVCVPTPVTKDKEPDLGPIKGAFETIAHYIKPKALLVLESTVNPGVCDEVVIPLVESLTKYKVGKDIYLAYCPERINPGDPNWDVSNINRVIGANSEQELKIAKELYESLVDAQIKPMGSLKEAEAVKVVENSFRDINIAFVNELAMSFHKLGINVENVIEGAATKPFAFIPHHPGCGVGGHCIPVDPYYLIEYAHGYGFNHEFLRVARGINDGMPAFTVGLLEEALEKLGKQIKGAKVALLGLSFKANVDDDRESPSYVIKDILEQKGANVVAYDPFMPQKSSAKSLDDALDRSDYILVATAHQDFIDKLTPKVLSSHKVQAFVDGRNVAKDLKQQFEEKNIHYLGIGVG